MFEYGHLKCVEIEDDFSWYFITVKNGNTADEKLDEKSMLLVLNKLGKQNWELVSIDPTIGFILKRRTQSCMN